MGSHRLYISIRLLCFEIIPSEETVAGFQWYITQGVNLLLTKVDIEFSILWKYNVYFIGCLPHIKHIREALRNSPYDIATVRGKGFKLFLKPIDSKATQP